MTSRHLESCITQHFGSVYMHVVFIDIVGYDKRRPPLQCEVMRGFTGLINRSLQRLTESYASRVPLEMDELASSILKVTTSEGIAVVFPFEQGPAAAQELVRVLTEAHGRQQQVDCRDFARAGWCHCHAEFHIATEIQQGEGFVYRDVNNAYSIAGSTVDFARRGRHHELGQELVGVAAGPAPALRPPDLHLEL